jgi:phage N-6-adenine-methyltransferase
VATLALVADDVAPVADEAIVADAIEARATGESASWREADCYLALSERGWTQQRIADKCGTTQQHVSKFTICARNYSVLSTRPPFWEAFAQVNSDKPKGEHNHRAQGTGENEWYTPAEYIEAARRVLGAIDLDPASSDDAQRVVQAKDYFTREQDGLTRKWKGRIWLNPPYSQPAIQQFAEKLVAEYEAHRVREAIVLTHNYTDTAWFHALASVSTAILFTRGRVGFVNPEGKSCNPTQGQAFFYLGDKPGAFKQEFSGFGFLVRLL